MAIREVGRVRPQTAQRALGRVERVSVLGNAIPDAGPVEVREVVTQRSGRVAVGINGLGDPVVVVEGL